MPQQLSDAFIQESFHSYLKSSLTQAKAERLLDTELLSSAEGDLMITGPALCLYFAALRCTTYPPSVPLPRLDKSTQPLELSSENCPPVFESFLRIWSHNVEPIQSLAPEHQHDLARVICGLNPLQNPSEPSVYGIAQDLRAVAIEISQRRSFQDKYASDLQAALDAGNAFSEAPKKAGFVPPPAYEPSPTSSPSHSGQPSPQYATHDLPPQSPAHLSPYSPPPSSLQFPVAQTSPGHTRTTSQPPSLQPSHFASHIRNSSVGSRSPSRSPIATPSHRTPSPASPTLLSPSTTRAIDLIRETLYASLADVLETQTQIRELLRRDSTKAYFSAVAFAILDVATHCITPDGAVVGVLGAELTLEMCPQELRPLMKELAMIGTMAKTLEEEDDRAAVAYARAQAERTERPANHRRQDDMLPPIPLMDRVKRMLIEGVGCEIPGTGSTGRRLQGEEGRRRSVEGRAVAFVNRVNGLSLNMTRLRPFRERQDHVFKILAGIGAD